MGDELERMAKNEPPRVKFGRGSMFGEPGNVERRPRIVSDCIEALKTMDVPGAIRELPCCARCSRVGIGDSAIKNKTGDLAAARLLQCQEADG